MTEVGKKKDWKGAKTAAETMAVLEADPEWVARREKREAEIQARIAERLKIEAPIVAELRDVGYDVSSVWDLVNTSIPYPDALPVLAKHLQREYPPAIKEGIARAMAVRDAKFAWPILVREYLCETDRRAKGGLAAALAAIVDDEHLPQLISLIKNRSNGARGLLLEGVFGSRHPEALAALVELTDDPELGAAINARLARREKRRKESHKRKPSSKLH